MGIWSSDTLGVGIADATNTLKKEEQKSHARDPDLTAPIAGDRGLSVVAATRAFALGVMILLGAALSATATYAQSTTIPKGVNDDKKWALSLMAGYASIDSDMYMAPKAWWSKSFREEAVVIGAASYNVVRFLRHFTLEAEIGIGHRFGVGANDAWAAAYVRYDNFPWNHVIRTTVAASLGLHYVSRLPLSENKADPTEARGHLLHYFSPEITFALPDKPEHELVMRLHHRSGVFGLMHGVHGGADAFVMGYRYRF